MELRLHCNTHQGLMSASLEDSDIAAHFCLIYSSSGITCIYCIRHLRYCLNQTKVPFKNSPDCANLRLFVFHQVRLFKLKNEKVPSDTRVSISHVLSYQSTVRSTPAHTPHQSVSLPLPSTPHHITPHHITP